jgi:hypothetical protein
MKPGQVQLMATPHQVQPKYEQDLRAYYTYCVGSANDTFLLISPEIAGMDTAYKRIEMWIEP